MLANMWQPVFKFINKKKKKKGEAFYVLNVGEGRVKGKTAFGQLQCFKQNRDIYITVWKGETEHKSHLSCDTA